MTEWDLLEMWETWQRVADPMLLITIISGVTGVLMLAAGLVVRRQNKREAKQ